MSDNKGENTKEKKCGIIMPISTGNGYDAEHWKCMLRILKSTIEEIGIFKPLPVWENENADIIQSTIINNILDCDIVVCDMSSTNPNVMYELGLRMAVKKPIVLVKDDATKPPFDINSIRFEEYPKDLHYFKINEFMEKLKQKIINTWEVYDKDPENYSQLIDLSEYKKYIIKGVGDEETPQTLQDAVNSIYQYIVKSSNFAGKEVSKGNSNNLIELSTTIWELKNQKKEFTNSIQKMSDTISQLTKEVDESIKEEIKDVLEEISEKYSVFKEELDTTLKKIEDVINE
jgi:nucleoside 2-deoxyribosyltransferase